MRLLLPLVTLALAVLPDSALASVLAIDYGAEFIKASLMKPGVPFDVLLNKDSKRKINSVVSWKNGDRLFGQDAFNIVRKETKGIPPCILISFSAGLSFPLGLLRQS